jgi:hypothetical protein
MDVILATEVSNRDDRKFGLLLDGEKEYLAIAQGTYDRSTDYLPVCT